MPGKFDNVPLEPDTKLLTQREGSIGDLDALYQQWSWDGITAESIIFVDEEVASLSDSELEDEVRSSGLVNPESEITLKRDQEGFTFANFNFESDS